MTMRITTDQVLAGYPAIKVRDFLWKHQLVLITEGNFQTSFNLINARSFLKKLIELELLRERYKHNGYSFFEMTDLGHSLAHASAAKPIHRKTAERVLSQFIERV